MYRQFILSFFFHNIFFWSPPIYLLLRSSVSSMIHCRRDQHYNSRYSIGSQIIQFDSGLLSFKYFYQHNIKLYSFQTHPGKGSQKQIMQESGYQRTQELQKYKDLWFRNDRLNKILSVQVICQRPYLHRNVWIHGVVLFYFQYTDLETYRLVIL